MKFPVILAAIATVSFAAPQIEVYEDSSAGHYRLLPGKSLEDADCCFFWSLKPGKAFEDEDCCTAVRSGVPYPKTLARRQIEVYSENPKKEWHVKEGKSLLDADCCFFW